MTKGFTKAIVVITTVTAAIMELLDTSIVNVALSNMAGSLGVNIEDVAWVITAYGIANVVIIPMTGFLAQYFGRKNYYVASMILFTIASYLCGNSTSLWELVLWRFVQGIGGGALLSTSQSILFDAFEPKERGMASGLFGMGIVLGPTLGPTVGGLVMEGYNWSWIFYINIPVGILATFLAVTFIEQKPWEGKQKATTVIDYWGILLLFIGVGSLQYVLERGESEDWFASQTIQYLTVSAVLGIVLFIWWELKTKNPVVNLRVANNRILAVTMVLTFVLGLGLFTSVYIYPVLVQRVGGWTPLETGLSLLAPTLSAVILFPFIGRRMSTGASPFPFIVIGMTFLIIFGFWGSQMTASANRWDWFWVLICRGIGIAFLQLPLINQAVAGLQPKDYPSGISLNNMIRQLGGTFGIAMSNNFIAQRLAQNRSNITEQMYAGNPIFDERVNTIAQGIMSRTGAGIEQATQMAYGNLQFAATQQASLLAYLNTFQFISIFFVVVFPLVFLLRQKKETGVSAAEAAKAAAEAH